jgi:hypothetical protein
MAFARTLEQERGRIASARSPIEFEKIGLYFGPPAALLIGGHVVASMFLDAEAMSYEPSVFIGGLVVLGVFFFGFVAYKVVRSVKDVDEPEPPVVVEAFVGAVGSLCSSCGGKIQFTIEQPSARCPFCGATVYPTPADQSALLTIAAERADLEVARAGRALTRSLALSFDAGPVGAALSWLRWLMFLVMPAILLVIGTGFLFQRGIPDPQALDAMEMTGAVMTGIGVFLVALWVLVVLLVLRLSRPRAIRRMLQQAARTFGGRIAGGLRPAFDWLDAHWAAEVTGDVFTASNSDSGTPIVRSSLALAFQERPVFLVAAHAPHVKRVDLFFSRHRRRNPAYGSASPAANEVRGAGWSVVVSNGGVHMTRLDSDPQGFPPPVIGWLLERAVMIAAA